MDRLQSMRVFAKVVELGSLAAAARELDLSPAVVTRLLADLEAHLNVRLLNRTTRRLALTEVGEAYLDRVRQILSELDEAEALAMASTREPRGELRLLMPPPFAAHQFAKHLPKFRARHPKVTIDLEVRSGPIETADEGCDVSVIVSGRHRPLRGDFVARLLARTEVIVCATPEYLDRRGRPQHPRELVEHEALVPVLPNVPREWVFQSGAWGDDEPGGDTTTISLQGALSTNHIDTLFAAALAGMGIVGLPSFMLEDALLEGVLERVLPHWRLMDFHIYAAMPSRKYMPARTRAFIDFLVETFGGEDRDPWLAAAGCETSGSAGSCLLQAATPGLEPAAAVQAEGGWAQFTASAG
ncbi:LysR family transcriptional regulator [Ideonella sp. BN130291]|uniref:LysR family transcriptional regulator n=1 Tax=Ideonella sp. BN130291 TaxID=3112940 RepID=UPI002E25498A|nr:LysR family transcriptional regulator [Ideonella sp. BN130291]